MGQKSLTTTKPTGLDERRLEHVREQREDAVERLELASLGLAVLDAGEELRENSQVEDQRRSKQGIL